MHHLHNMHDRTQVTSLVQEESRAEVCKGVHGAENQVCHRTCALW